jgi:hypothetical protein
MTDQEKIEQVIRKIRECASNPDLVVSRSYCRDIPFSKDDKVYVSISFKNKINEDEVKRQARVRIALLKAQLRELLNEHPGLADTPGCPSTWPDAVLDFVQPTEVVDTGVYRFSNEGPAIGQERPNE